MPSNKAFSTGIPTSIQHTPQGVDDSWNFNVLDIDLNGTITVNPLANDLGGNSITVFSLDDGPNSMTDLLTKDAVGVWEDTLLHNQISIVDGKVVFKLADSLDLTQIDDTVTMVDSFDVAIQMGNGALAIEHQQVNITGTHHVGELIANWSFEEGQNTSGGAWQAVNPLPGWVIAGDSAAIEVVSAGYGTPPINGDGHWVDTQGTNGPIHFSTGADLITGHAGVLSMSLAAENIGGLLTDPAETVHLKFNGTEVLAVTGAQVLAAAGGNYGVFETFSANVVGIAGMDNIEVQVTGVNTNVGMALDWVSLIG